jgi:hypothetical protein
MFGRKVPTIEAQPSDKPPTATDSGRTTSYRVDQDTAPTTTGALRTTSYVNAMQRNTRGYETIN